MPLLSCLYLVINILKIFRVPPDFNFYNLDFSDDRIDLPDPKRNISAQRGWEGVTSRLINNKNDHTKPFME